jgi:hypothetical protein
MYVLPHSLAGVHSFCCTELLLLLLRPMLLAVRLPVLPLLLLFSVLLIILLLLLLLLLLPTSKPLAYLLEGRLVRAVQPARTAELLANNQQLLEVWVQG